MCRQRDIKVSNSWKMTGSIRPSLQDTFATHMMKNEWAEACQDDALRGIPGYSGPAKKHSKEPEGEKDTSSILLVPELPSKNWKLLPP